MQSLGLSGTVADLDNDTLTLDKLGSSCYETAATYEGFSTKGTRRKPLMEKPAALCAAEIASTVAPRGSVEKKAARKKEGRSIEEKMEM